MTDATSHRVQIMPAHGKPPTYCMGWNDHRWALLPDSEEQEALTPKERAQWEAGWHDRDAISKIGKPADA